MNANGGSEHARACVPKRGDTSCLGAVLTSLRAAPPAQVPCRTVATGAAVPAVLTLCVANFTITGGGTIRATHPNQWWRCAMPVIGGCPRPHLVSPSAVEGLRVADITLNDAANHNLRILASSHVRVDSVTITAPHDSPNTDGVNFYGGFDQALTNSVVSNGDDCVSVVPVNEFDVAECIAPDQPPLQLCSGGNVVVRNVSCIGSHGISIGGVRNGNVNNVSFTNMTATGVPFDTQGQFSPGGLRIKSYPNGTGVVHNINYTDIVLNNVYLAVELQAVYCPHGGCGTGRRAVQFTNITFRGIRSSTTRGTKALVSCSPLAPCTGIVLDNVVLAAPGDKGAAIECAHASVDFLGSTAPGECTNATTAT